MKAAGIRSLIYTWYAVNELFIERGELEFFLNLTANMTPEYDRRSQLPG
jgi:hypothetical protein